MVLSCAATTAGVLPGLLSACILREQQANVGALRQSGYQMPGQSRTVLHNHPSTSESIKRMKYEDIIAKYCGAVYDKIPTPEYIDEFIDEMMCVDDMDVNERNSFGYGVLLGLSTAMAYIAAGKGPHDIVSRMTQFTLTMELRQE
jgi:hypothetical protein